MGDVEIDTARACLRRGGEELHVRPRTMQVLLHLIEHRDRVVSKEELLDRFWKDTAVTDDALSQCLTDIRRVFADNSKDPRILKTVPKVGYRFVGVVDDPTPSSGVSRRRLMSAAAAVLAVAVLSGFWWWRAARQTTEPVNVALETAPGRTPVVVMYLDNQSRNRELDWLREGLADMLIANLSRSSRFAVLSRQELHVLLKQVGHRDDAPADLQAALAIARRSRASVVALGTFATLGAHIRVTVQLHDAGTGRLLGSESATVEAADRIPERMERLAANLAAHFGVALLPRDGTPSPLPVMTNDLEAYRYYSTAVERANDFDTSAAIQLLEKAVAIDDEFAMAYARIGYAYAVTGLEPERGRTYLERAYRLASRLTEKDRLLITAWHATANLDYQAAIDGFRQVIANYPAETEAYWRLAELLRGEDRHEEAIRVAERGLDLNPDADEALQQLGVLHAEAGNLTQAVDALTRARTLAPTNPWGHTRLGMVLRWGGRYEEAVASFQRALALDPASELALTGLGNVSYDRGRLREAVAHYQRYLAGSGQGRPCAQPNRFTAAVYLRRGDLDRAAQAADAAMKCDATAIWYPLLVALERGQTARARELRDRLENSVTPPDRGHRSHRRWKAFERGTLLLRDGRHAEAIALFKEALRHRPVLWNIERMEDCLANAYLQIGRLDEAIDEYRRVLRLNPNDGLSRYRLGLALERKNMKAEAHAEFARALEIWKDADADLPELRDLKPRLTAGL